MFELTNSISIKNYTYEVADDITKTHDTDPAQVTTQINQADVSFVKKITPVAIDHGETATLTYTVVNNSTADISAAMINDPLLTSNGLVPTVLSGGTIEDGILTVDLKNPLNPRKTKDIAIAIKATEQVLPSKNAYTTLATASFTIDTLVPTSVVKNSSATFAVNCAELKVTKISDAVNGQILEGNALTYTISIMNIGNVEATIPVGGLVDDWTANAIQNARIRSVMLDTTTLDPNIFKVSASRFSNVKSIVIPGQRVLSIKLSGNVSIPKSV